MLICLLKLREFAKSTTRPPTRPYDPPPNTRGYAPRTSHAQIYTLEHAILLEGEGEGNRGAARERRDVYTWRWKYTGRKEDVVEGKGIFGGIGCECSHLVFVVSFS
jgi:hypothetical protein